MHEIASWVFDKRQELSEETCQLIREELKDIKLREGECLVCNGKLVSADCFENILKILEKNKLNNHAVDEFRTLFGLSPELIISL